MKFKQAYQRWQELESSDDVICTMDVQYAGQQWTVAGANAGGDVELRNGDDTHRQVRGDDGDHPVMFTLTELLHDADGDPFLGDVIATIE